MPAKPSSPRFIESRKAVILRKIAYFASGLLFVLWGMFFIEHLVMFQSLQTNPPPLAVWIVQILHGLLLAGYMLVFKWPRLACVVITITAIPFFALTADQNALFYTLFSLIPVYLMGYLWWKEKQESQKTAPRG